jgi:hypothetical protein
MKGSLWGWKSFSSYLAPRCSDVTKTSHVTLLKHALQGVKVWSISIEGWFTREAEKVFHLHVTTHCRGWSERDTWHPLSLTYNQWKFGQNNVMYLWDWKSLSQSHLTLHRGTKMSHLTLPAHALQWVKLWSESVSNQGNFTPEAETVFPPYLA